MGNPFPQIFSKTSEMLRSLPYKTASILTNFRYMASKSEAKAPKS